VNRKKFIGWGAGVALALYLFLLGLVSLTTGQPETGVVDGHLRPCPDKPNCVCSEDESASSFIEPLAFQGPTEEAWTKAMKAVLELGGTIEKETEDYLWATFKTRILRFVDDVELRMDRENKVIHLRSASRLGHSDLGVNRERIEALKSVFEENLNL